MDADGAIMHLLEQIELLNGAENFQDDWRIRRDAMVAEANVARLHLYAEAPPSADSVDNALVFRRRRSKHRPWSITSPIA